MQGAGDEAAATRRELTIVVPEGAKPGSTQLQVDIGLGEKLVVTVPSEAREGDPLVLAETAEGSWTCSQVTRYVEVPDGAVPGETQLRYEAPGGTELQIILPKHALPGDRLRLDRDRDGQWSVQIIRERPKERKTLEVCLPDVAVDADAVYLALVDAARRAGATVSGKIMRGKGPPPLCLMGMVTTGRIEEGEELCRMPGRLLPCLSNYEDLMPELCAAVRAAGATGKAIPEGRISEACQNTCLAALLLKAQDRVLSGKGSGAGERSEAAKSAVGEVWDLYAEALLGEPFADHPLSRALLDSEAAAAAMAPSREHGEAQWQAGQAVAVCSSLREHLPAEALGCTLDAGLYMQAHLSVQSRAFTTGRGVALVPITDFCNHSAEPGAQWRWDDEGDAHVLTATRAHDAGDELLISYGAFSNVMLFRAYGFTLPPKDEHHWSFLVQRTRPEALFKKYLPPSMAGHILHLCTNLMRQSLVSALNGCHDHGTNAEDFLRDVLDWSMPAYREDPVLAPALKALDKARAEDPCSHAWWDHWDGVDAHVGGGAPAWTSQLGGHWPECAVRVKMSEFLCLTVHKEALEVAAGRLPAERCLKAADGITGLLVETLQLLRQGVRVSLTTLPK